MGRTQNVRWKRKAVAVAALALSFAGYAATTNNTVGASNYGEWDCPGTDPLDAVASNNDEPCATDNTIADTSIEVASGAAVPDTSIPTTDPVTTDPYVTQPIPTEAPPAPGVPSVSGSAVCGSGTGTINLTLGNTGGELPITFTVTHPVSGVTTTLMVESGTSQQLTLLGTTVGTVNVAINAGGIDMSRSFQINSTCAVQAPPVVAASPEVVVAPKKALPVTGRGSALPTLFIAIGLFGAGSVAVAFARRSSGARSNHS
jgi:hypothetical protein